ncbi:CinA family protein [Mycoplasma procyoni]|uniref:CinA family protein n=1 Tax=Mycoplasma procyoni TaxID=568784 RepID=UPI00197BDDD2|nr:CinA family protein [Mycoplasma procyoni]MBN3534874.1 CinA family protein [Mycoplasma procyoni]
MKTLSSVESFTGGAFAAKIVRIPGASKFFKGALVTYANEIKEKLGVDTSAGVVNSKIAREMALKGKEFFNTDFCVSFTGNAGPDVLDNKPVGRIYISINEEVFEFNLKGSRSEIIDQAVNIAFEMLITQNKL